MQVFNTDNPKLFKSMLIMIFIRRNKFHITVRTVPGLVIYFVALAFYFALITVFNLKIIFRMIVSGIDMEGIHSVVDGIAFVSV